MFILHIFDELVIVKRTTDNWHGVENDLAHRTVVKMLGEMTSKDTWLSVAYVNKFGTARKVGRQLAE